MAGAGLMKPGRALDRAALVLGVVSIVSTVFVFVWGNFQLVQMAALGWRWQSCSDYLRSSRADWTNPRCCARRVLGSCSRPRSSLPC
jgi:hypothetical protein